MRLPLLALVPLFLAALPASAQDLHANFSPVLESLKRGAADDPAAAPRAEQAKGEAGKSFDGGAPLPISVKVLSPVGFVDAPGAPRSTPTPQTQAAPPVPAPKDVTPKETGPGYHFEGKSPLPGLTLYTPVKDTPGGDNGTHGGKGGGGLFGILKWALLGLGALLIASFFFPPLLVFGGALVAAGGYLAAKTRK